MSEQAKSKPDKGPYEIKVDKKKYSVAETELTGAQLRQVPSPAIAEKFDLFEELPHGLDRKIADDYVVEIYEGKVFYTAPGKINPGRS